MPASDGSNIVLVHGGFVDGSGWEGVYKILKDDGHNVTGRHPSRLALRARSSG